MNFVAFDIGNVLMELDMNAFHDEFELHNMHLFDKTFKADILAQQDLGLTTLKRELHIRFDDKVSTRAIQSVAYSWERVIIPNETMLNFLEKLKKNHIKIALLSNIGLEHVRLIREKYSDLFKDNILHLSCEVGARKPSKLYFQSFLLEHPEFRGCVYLDDLDDNLRVGKSFGFCPVKFELDKFLLLSEEKQKEKLSDLINLINSCPNFFNL